MRFNSLIGNKEAQNLVDYIFDSCLSDGQSKYEGFRNTGYDKIKSRYFTFVFLCGGNKDYYNSRDVLTKILINNPSIKIIISEDLQTFRGELDLLTFEAVLESISKMILIPVESFGTACELGAFTRIGNQRNKVVAILDEKHKKDVSFINYGPIEYLKSLGNQRVYYASYQRVGNHQYLLTNSSIENLYSNELITRENKFVDFISGTIGDGTEKKITNLDSFIVAILDFLCLTGMANVDTIYYFFSRLLETKKLKIKSTNIECDDENSTREIISCSLKIFENLGFLKSVGDMYLTAPQIIMKEFNRDEQWIGTIIFNKAFTKTKKYLVIKAKAFKLRKRYEKIWESLKK